MTKRGELTTAQKVKAGGGAGLALAAALALSAAWEGYSRKPYVDPVGVLTVCRGETHVPMRTYTDAECDRIDQGRMVARMREVQRVNPRISSSPLQWAAHASFANNIGIGAYAKSSVLKLFVAGDEAEACLAMTKYKYAGGRVFQGLLLRRTGDSARLGEAELCLQGVVR